MLKGECEMIDVDVSQWTAGDSRFSCKIGLYNEDSPNEVDFMELSMAYDPNLGAQQKWTINDGFGTQSDQFNYQLESDGSVFIIPADECAFLKKDNKASIRGVWARKFSSDDNTGDIDIEAGNDLRALIRMEAQGGETAFVKGKEIDLSDVKKRSSAGKLATSVFGMATMALTLIASN